MTTVEELRENIQLCEAMAAGSVMPTDKEAWMRLADAWRRMLAQHEHEHAPAGSQPSRTRA